MTTTWECPRCERVYPDAHWTIGGGLVRPRVWRRVLTRLRGLPPEEPIFVLWHRCPAGHRFPKGAPYASLTSGPTRAYLSDGTPVTFNTLLQTRRTI